MRNEEKAAIMMAVQTDTPSMMWGNPGQGKSSMVRQGLPQLDYTVRVLRVNTMLPHQIHGNQVADLEAGTTRYLPPAWALELNQAAKSVLFLDDVSCATQATQTACLGLMDEREVSGLVLKAVPIAAANPNTLATARFDLDAAAANRALHVQVTSHGETFRGDAMAGFPAPQVPEIRSNWKQRVERKLDIVTQFTASPEGEPLLNNMPQRITPETVAWPSERSWEMFWTFMAACDAIVPESMEGIDLVATRTLLLKGSVGPGAYEAFNNYYLDPMDVNVDDALKKGKRYSLPERGDRVFGLLAAVTRSLHSESSINKTKWRQAWGLLEAVWESSHRDRGVTFALDLVSLAGGDNTPPKFYDTTIRPALDQVA